MILRVLILLVSLMPGCYLSTGASFYADASADPAADDAAIDDARPDDTGVDDTVPDDISPDDGTDEAGEDLPAPCSAPELLRATGIDYLGEASPRVTGAAFYDADRDRVVVYGGLRGSGDYTPDAVAIELDTGEIKILGYDISGLQGWTYAGTAYDPEGDRVFVVNGTVVGEASRRVLVIRNIGDDALEASTHPSFPKLSDRGTAVGYDPVGRRLVVVIGVETADNEYRSETWMLDPDEASLGWSLINEAPEPVPYDINMMVHVPYFGLVMLKRSTYEYTGVRQIFRLQPGRDSTTWEEIPLQPAWIPGNRPVIFWDPHSCRLITWGGGCTEGAYSIDIAAKPAPVTEISLDLDGFGPRVFMNPALDTKRRRIVIHGGYDCGVYNFLTGVESIRFD